MNFTDDEVKLLFRALTVLSNNIRYSLREKPYNLQKEILPIEELNKKLWAFSQTK